MNKIAQLVFLFFGIVFLLLGIIFAMAAGDDSENGIIGIVLLGVAFLLFFMAFMGEALIGKFGSSMADKVGKKDYAYHDLVNSPQAFIQRDLSCEQCDTEMKASDLKEVDSGIIATCPRCKRTKVFEEQPRW